MLVSASQHHGNSLLIPSPAGRREAPEAVPPAVEETKSHRASTPSAVFIRSERYTQLQQSLSVSRSDVGGATEATAVAAPSDGAKLASGNILTFIQAQLQRDVQDGATQEELASRIDAGLSGFLQGFGEAKAQLEQMGFLNETIAAEIQQTHDLVLQGVDELRATYLGDSASGESGVALNSGVVESFARVEQAQSREFTFKVTTRDGDEVQIGVSALRASLTQAYGQSGSGIATLMDYTRQQSSREEFSLSITGELDEGELKALNDLLSKVNDLSKQFYEGDLEKAFSSAMELGYDSSEISSFALKMSQTQVQKVTQTYQEVSGQQAQSGALAQAMKPLGGFVQGVIDALGYANRFEQGADLLTDLGQWFEASAESHFHSYLGLVVDGVKSLDA